MAEGGFGMGHAWSGGCSCAAYADPSGPDATRATYDFFMRHPMARSSAR
jgi:hypothetical protein